MEKYSLSLTTANNPNVRSSKVCKCSEGQTTCTHQLVMYPSHPDYFYKKLPVSRGKTFKDLRRREAQRRTEDNGQYGSIKVKSKGVKVKDSQEVQVQAVKRTEPRVVKQVKRESFGRGGLLRRSESDEEEEEERSRVSFRRLTRVANWHHLPRVAAKPRSLSATSSSTCSSLLSASRNPRAQQRTSSIPRLLPSPSIRSFSPSSHLQCSNTYRPTSHPDHTSNKMSASTSNLLQSPPSSPLSHSPPHLSLSSSSVLEFLSSLSSLKEGHNLPEEKNREVDVYLQVPTTILVSSNRRLVETGLFLSNLSPAG